MTLTNAERAGRKATLECIAKALLELAIFHRGQSQKCRARLRESSETCLRIIDDHGEDSVVINVSDGENRASVTYAGGFFHFGLAKYNPHSCVEAAALCEDVVAKLKAMAEGECP